MQTYLNDPNLKAAFLVEIGKHVALMRSLALAEVQP